jgi:hypothetical protein
MFRLEFEIVHMGLSAKHATEDLLFSLASAARFALLHNPVSFVLTTGFKHCSLGVQMKIIKLAFALNEFRFNINNLLSSYWAEAQATRPTC